MKHPFNVTGNIAWFVSIFLLANFATASTILPPRDLGHLLEVSELVVLAKAGDHRSALAGGILHTLTSFEILKHIKGAVHPGARIEVSTFGGEIDGLHWLVPGSPKFENGSVYLLFLVRAGDDMWQPPAMAYGQLEQTLALDDRAVLQPMAQSRDIVTIPRPDGQQLEVPGIYWEKELIEHLTEISFKREKWSSDRVLVPQDIARRVKPAEIRSDSIPSTCAFFAINGVPIRWERFDHGDTLSLAVDAEGYRDFDSLGLGKGFDQIAAAVGAWMQVPHTSIQWSFNDTLRIHPDCERGGASGDRSFFDTTDIFVFMNDPCQEIPNPNLLDATTLAFGGPWFYDTLTHLFNGMEWITAIKGFVVLNDGLGGFVSILGAEFVLGAATLLGAHELGHVLGLDHTQRAEMPDPFSAMTDVCCQPINATDEGCVQYAYPREVAVSVPDFKHQQGLQVEIFPNPVSSEIHLTVKSPTTDNIQVELFDLLGRPLNTLWHGRLFARASHFLTFEVGSVQPGQYILQVRSSVFVETRKVVLH